MTRWSSGSLNLASPAVGELFAQHLDRIGAADHHVLMFASNTVFVGTVKTGLPFITKRGAGSAERGTGAGKISDWRLEIGEVVFI